MITIFRCFLDLLCFNQLRRPAGKCVRSTQVKDSSELRTYLRNTYVLRMVFLAPILVVSYISGLNLKGQLHYFTPLTLRAKLSLTDPTSESCHQLPSLSLSLPKHLTLLIIPRLLSRPCRMLDIVSLLPSRGA